MQVLRTHHRGPSLVGISKPLNPTTQTMSVPFVASIMYCLGERVMFVPETMNVIVGRDDVVLQSVKAKPCCALGDTPMAFKMSHTDD